MNRTDRVLHNPDRSCATYIRLAALVVVVVGLAINFWLKSYLAITTEADIIQRNEGLSSAANPHLPVQSGSPKVMVTTDVNVINVREAKPELLPMLNPYLPWRGATRIAAAFTSLWLE
jgi:hypothetical protein